MRVKCKCVICSCSSKKTTKHKYILFLMSNPFVLDTYPVSLSACLLIGTTLNSLSGIKIKPSKEWQSNPTFIYISTPHLQKHCSPLYSTSYVRAAWLCWDNMLYRICQKMFFLWISCQHFHILFTRRALAFDLSIERFICGQVQSHFWLIKLMIEISHSYTKSRCSDLFWFF